MHIGNIHLIGTSHVADESIEEVKKAIADEPGIVALELDPGRAYALEHEVRRPKNFALLKQLGVGGFLFYIVAEYVQQRVGNVLDIQPGSEMRTALQLAKKQDCKIFLIDRDIQITLRRLSRHFRKREILTMAKNLVAGLVGRKTMQIDLRKVPSDKIIQLVLEETRRDYPSLYRVLIAERDAYMSKQLVHISRMYPDQQIVAVVGAGHVPGMTSMLKRGLEVPVNPDVMVVDEADAKNDADKKGKDGRKKKDGKSASHDNTDSK